MLALPRYGGLHGYGVTEPFGHLTDRLPSFRHHLDEGTTMTFGAVMNPMLRPGHDFAASSFVGRRGEMRELKKLLSDCRLITVTGPGGVGKSRLAHRMAASLRRAYGDEIRYIDLVEARDAHLLTRELQDPDVLAHLVAGTLGLGPAGAGAGTAMEALAASLPPRPVLLLLDNCEHLLPACAVLAETLLQACPQLRIMATSREPLRLGAEVIFPAPPLPIPQPAERVRVAELGLCDSVALFVDRAESVTR